MGNGTLRMRHALRLAGELTTYDRSNPFVNLQAQSLVSDLRLRPVATFTRPDDGPGVILYQRPG